MAEPGTKICSACGEEKPISAFHRRAASRDGLNARCKVCLLAAKKQAHARHPERERERQRRHYLRHRDRIRERVRRYRETNTERLRAYGRQRAQLEHIKVATALRTRRRNDRVRGIEDSDWAEVLRADVCAYCGERGGTADHIDPDLAQGTFENLTGACLSCNSKKQDRTLVGFLLSR